MKTLLDLRPVHPGMTGIGRYALNLCRSLERVGSVEIEALSSERATDFLRERTKVRLHVAPPDPAWDHVGLPELLRRGSFDVFHSPLFLLPSVRACMYVSTIHDVIPLACPEYATAQFKAFFDAQIDRAVRRSSRIVTVSQHSMQDILKHLRVDPEKVVEVYEPVGEIFRRRTEEECRRDLKDLRMPAAFLLYVGALDRRKNLQRLLQAYKILREARPNAPDLAVVGGPSGDGYDISRDIRSLGLDRFVRLLGWIPDAALVALYTSASVFVFPSLYEGFGLPVVEAMACGTPVVTSRSTSLREIAGDAAVLVDPELPEEIASGIGTLLDDANRRRTLIERGLRRAAFFSLERQGAQLLELYESLMSRTA